MPPFLVLGVGLAVLAFVEILWLVTIAQKDHAFIPVVVTAVRTLGTIIVAAVALLHH